MGSCVVGTRDAAQASLSRLPRKSLGNAPHGFMGNNVGTSHVYFIRRDVTHGQEGIHTYTCGRTVHAGLRINECVCARAHVCVCVCVRACVRGCVCVCMSVCASVCRVPARMGVCMHHARTEPRHAAKPLVQLSGYRLAIQERRGPLAKNRKIA